MILEIFIYLVILFGILVVSMTMFDSDEWLSNKCYMPEMKDGTVVLNIRMEGLDETAQKNIIYILENGKYNNIYDFVEKIEINA